jgi:ATP-dependent DNA helicase PIF1
LSRRAILAPYNEVVVALNKTLPENMPSAQSTFLFVDQSATDCAAAYPTEFLHAIDVPELAAHELRLKVGCPMLLLRNLDPSNGLCNGTRLRVHRLGRNVITCTGLGSTHHGNMGDLEGLELQRRQFPVRVAFALTINKAQGQSFDRIGLNLQREVFYTGSCTLHAVE